MLVKQVKVNPGGHFASWGQEGLLPGTAMADLLTITVPSTAWALTKGPGLNLRRSSGPISRVWGEIAGGASQGH